MAERSLRPVLDAHAVFKAGDDRGESARVGIQRGHGKPHTASTCYGMSGRPGRAPGERPDCPVNRVDWRQACPSQYVRRQGGHDPHIRGTRSEEHTSELQSLMRISYAVFCLKKKKKKHKKTE